MPVYNVQGYTAAAVAVGVVGSVYAAYRLYQELNGVKIPQNWRLVGTLSDIYIYPVKSCGPVIVDKAECTSLGLKKGWLRDRILMVVDIKNNFITARAYPDMLLVKPSIKSSVLTLTYGDMETLYVDLAGIIESGRKPTTAKVWNVEVPVYDCGYEPSEWFSRLLSRSANDFRLAYYASYKSRSLRDRPNPFYTFKQADMGALPDELSYNLINEASVEDLNTRVKGAPISHRCFRPNFVLKGAQAYDEDNWKFVKIGENIFEIIKPCTRCIMTTIDPETGIRNDKCEPLETLRSYRQVENPEEMKMNGRSPRMGLQMALRSGPGGLVSLNDPIYVA